MSLHCSNATAKEFVESAASGLFGGDSAFTLAGWFKLNVTGLSSTQTLISNEFSTSEPLVLQVLTNGKLQGKAEWSSGSDTATTAGQVVSDDTWHFCAMVYDGTDLVVRCDKLADEGSTATASKTTKVTSDEIAVGKTTTNDQDLKAAHVCYWASAVSSANLDAMADGAHPLDYTPAWYVPLTSTSGSAVVGTDASLDDGVGSVDLDTVNESPVWANDNPSVDPEGGGGGGATGAFSAAEVLDDTNNDGTGCLVQIDFAAPAAGSWTAPTDSDAPLDPGQAVYYIEDTSKRPTFAVTSEGYSGDTLGTRARTGITINKIKSIAVNAGVLEVVCYLSEPIYDDDTSVTTTTTANWLEVSDDGDITGAAAAQATTNSSEQDYPKANAKWATPDHQDYDSTFNVDVAACCRNAVAAGEYGIERVDITVEDSAAFSQTITATLTDVSREGERGVASEYGVWRAAFDADDRGDASPFATGTATISFVVYPEVGDADSRSLSSGSPLVNRTCSLHRTISTYYLDPDNGDDSANGTTTGTPKKTLKNVLDTLNTARGDGTVDGCRAIILDGTYTNSVFDTTVATGSYTANTTWVTVEAQTAGGVIMPGFKADQYELNLLHLKNLDPDYSSVAKNARDPAMLKLGTNPHWCAYWSQESPGWMDCYRITQAGQELTAADDSAWTGTAFAYRSDGYPTTIPAGARWMRRCYVNIDGHYPTGNYTVYFDGTGTIKISGDATATITTSGTTFNVASTSNSGLRFNLDVSDVGDPVNNIRVVLPGYAARYSTEHFTDEYITHITKFDTIRFMLWMLTNDNNTKPTPQVDWTDRPDPDKGGYLNTTQNGVPVEWMVALCNRVNANPWFCMPHGTTDAYNQSFAEYVRDNLNPELKVYVEFSNEVWNSAFDQIDHVDQVALDNNYDQAPYSVPQFQRPAAGLAHESVRIWKVWNTVFSEPDVRSQRSTQSRLVRVIAWQNSNSFGADKYCLPFTPVNATVAAREYADAYSPASYFAKAIRDQGSVDHFKDNHPVAFADAITNGLTIASGATVAAAVDTDTIEVGTVGTIDNWRGYRLTFTSGAANGQFGIVRWHQSALNRVHFTAKLTAAPAASDTFDVTMRCNDDLALWVDYYNGDGRDVAAEHGGLDLIHYEAGASVEYDSSWRDEATYSDALARLKALQKDATWGAHYEDAFARLGVLGSKLHCQFYMVGGDADDDYGLQKFLDDAAEEKTNTYRDWISANDVPATSSRELWVEGCVCDGGDSDVQDAWGGLYKSIYITNSHIKRMSGPVTERHTYGEILVRDTRFSAIRGDIIHSGNYNPDGETATICCVNVSVDEIRQPAGENRHCAFLKLSPCNHDGVLLQNVKVSGGDYAVVIARAANGVDGLDNFALVNVWAENTDGAGAYDSDPTTTPSAIPTVAHANLLLAVKGDHWLMWNVTTQGGWTHLKNDSNYPSNKWVTNLDIRNSAMVELRQDSDSLKCHLESCLTDVHLQYESGDTNLATTKTTGASVTTGDMGLDATGTPLTSSPLYDTATLKLTTLDVSGASWHSTPSIGAYEGEETEAGNPASYSNINAPYPSTQASCPVQLDT